MKKQTFKEKREHIKQEKLLEEKHYRIIISFAILDVLYYFFIQPKIIGNDIRYTIFIFWIPFITGIFVNALYNRKLLQRLKKFNLEVIAIALFLLVEGAVFSYMVFGMPAKMGFEGICYLTANKNPVETVECNVKYFKTKGTYRNRRRYVLGEFDNKNEWFYCSHKYIKQFENVNPQDYKIVITARKAVWNHYLVDDWEVVKK